MLEERRQLHERLQRCTSSGLNVKPTNEENEQWTAEIYYQAYAYPGQGAEIPNPFFSNLAFQHVSLTEVRRCCVPLPFFFVHAVHPNWSCTKFQLQHDSEKLLKMESFSANILGFFCFFIFFLQQIFWVFFFFFFF